MERINCCLGVSLNFNISLQIIIKTKLNKAIILRHIIGKYGSAVRKGGRPSGNEHGRVEKRRGWARVEGVTNVFDLRNHRGHPRPRPHA